jgi:RimJ/RimL family protein N-acetyltransferase
LNPELVSVENARDYWEHPSQRFYHNNTDFLPTVGFEYWACGPICGAFQAMPWEGVFMAHYGVKPDGWGQLVKPAQSILRAFSGAHRVKRVIGWTDKRNRAAVALALRIGFEVDGEMPGIVMTGWGPDNGY